MLTQNSSTFHSDKCDERFAAAWNS